LVGTHLDALAYGVLSREKLLRKRVGDDHHGSCIALVAVAEGTPSHQWDLHRFEETRRNDVEAGAGLIGLGRWVVEQIERNSPAIAVEWERQRAGGSGYAGQRTQPGEQVMHETNLLVAVVGSLGKVELGG